MDSQNNSENNSKKHSASFPPPSIPDSISIPAVSISSSSQISRDDPTIEAEKIGKISNNKEPSSEKSNKTKNKKNTSIATLILYKSIAGFSHSVKTDDYLLRMQR